ncbi:MAG: nuclear transport factor 2 family protein [Alphaproteobacteria bacterium]|nr:nuclear transport factor 2 family protein [Alphaproteobacteria bacterium]
MIRLAAAVLFATTLLAAAPPSVAQTPVAASADHAVLLAHPDPRLAANKRLVYDFWREVFEAAHMDLAEKYMLASYIQHNPNVPDGRAAFVSFFSKIRQPKPIEPRVAAPLVAILADGDLVTLVFARELPEPSDATKKYTTTWFDMFRIENGKIAEHWDPAVKR